MGIDPYQAIVFTSITMCPLFRKKRFMLDEMFQGNASKFALLLEYKKPCSFFRFSFHATLFFPLMHIMKEVFSNRQELENGSFYGIFAPTLV